MPDTTREFYNVCPHCWSVRVKLRIFKAPRYKCEVCGSVFPNKKRVSHGERILFNELMKTARRHLGAKNTDDVKLRKLTAEGIKELLRHA